MSTKGAIWVVAVCLAAALGWFVADGLRDTPDPGRAVPAPEDARLWTVDFRRIAQVEVSDSGQDRSSAWRRADEGWQRVGDPIGQSVWLDGADALLGRPGVRLVSSGGALAPFGLEEPQMTVTIALESGQSFAALVGDRLPDGSGHYVMREGAGGIYAIDHTWVAAMRGLLEEGEGQPASLHIVNQ